MSGALRKRADVVPFQPRPVTQLTSAEEELVVDVSKDSVTMFTQKHCDTLKRLRILERHPRIYGSLSIMNYNDTEIIPVDKIDCNNAWFDQSVRAIVNPELSSIRDDIENNGFSLTVLPPMVMKRKDGTYLELDGRTRYHHLAGFGMKNMIVDVFEEEVMGKVIKFALFMNNQGKPFGKASIPDIKKAIMGLIEIGDIPRLGDSVLDIQEMTDIIISNLKDMSCRLSPGQENEIVHDGIHKLTGVQQVRSFPNGQGNPTPKEWLNLHGYIDTREHYYLPISNMVERSFTTLKHRRSQIPKETEIRAVVYIGVPSATDPEGDWKKTAAGFKENWKEIVSWILENFKYEPPECEHTEENVDPGRIVERKIKIYGAIPQIKSLNHKYPMDKLYVFDPRDLK